MSHRVFSSLSAAPMMALLLIVSLLIGCQQHAERKVVLYTSQDQDFAEPILKQFTRDSGIRVETVFDSEAVKTLGLANRLIAEQAHPQCDVWWSNEELRTRQLAARGVFRATNGWAAFGFRSRRLVLNTNKLSLAQAPSLLALTNAAWRGKVALAYPMFGTTCAQMAVLRQQWGADRWDAWCRALIANKPFLVDGNSVVVKLVGRGEAIVGLTDSDDVRAGLREGLPIAAAPIGIETLLIPNTVAVVNGAPHSSEAWELFHYLQGPDVANMMVAVGAIEGTNVSVRPHLGADWPRIVAELDVTTARMKEIFLR